jgi:F-type H+-transporting ATPase subunit delta
MKDRVVAHRYARALFQAVAPAHTAAVRQDLVRFVQLLAADEVLDRALNHPLLSAAKKAQIAVKAFGPKPADPLERFIQIVLEKKRMSLMPYMAELFGEMADEASGIKKVQVQAASPMKPEQIKDLESHLSKIWASRVQVDLTVNENLIGGLVFRSGDRVWDHSVRAQLAQIREKFLKSAAV